MSASVLVPLLLMVFLALLNLPIWLAILGGCLTWYLYFEPSVAPQILAQKLGSMCESNAYLAIPYFVMAGACMNYSGISSRLMDLADALVGHLTGGLGLVNVLLSTLMGGVSGSAVADAALETKILVPEMLKHGYDEDFSAAVTIGSALITPVIPPGMGLIMFGFMTSTSVGRLFAAGYVPGLLSMICQMIYVYFYSKKHHYGGGRDHGTPFLEIMKLLGRSIWALLLPFGIIMGIRFGVMTATEAGALCVWYSLLVGIVIYHEFRMKDFLPVMKESVLGVGTVMILVCSASCLSYFLTYEGLVLRFKDWILAQEMSKAGFLIMTCLVLLVIGMFIEGSPSMIILSPLLTPIAVAMGIDPVHYGIIFNFAVGIGNMTPPFGLVLYQVSGLMGIPLVRLSKKVLPFCAIMIGILFLLCFIPKVVLFLPNLIYG
jgi:tripartite ATP-independent transporter DctM subunit